MFIEIHDRRYVSICKLFDIDVILLGINYVKSISYF